jgi:hypothetical protein
MFRIETIYCNMILSHPAFMGLCSRKYEDISINEEGHMNEIEVLVPIAEAKFGEIEMAQRPLTISGKTIGFLWNSKSNGDLLLKNLESRLMAKYGFSEIFMKRKKMASSGAPPELLEELSAKCDLVVLAIGD